jgi:hypothetical protein
MISNPNGHGVYGLDPAKSTPAKRPFTTTHRHQQTTTPAPVIAN